MFEDSSIEHLHRCPICQNEKTSDEYSRPDEHLGILSLVRCNHCDIVFLNPRLAPAATQILEDASSVYAYDDATTERTIAALESMIDNLGAFAPRKGSLLDIGCNRGFLLEAARRRGWNATGIEISPAAIAEARRLFGNINIYGGEIDALPRDMMYDLITCWHVLEHTSFPVEFLQHVAKHLSNKGAIAIQVPSYTFFSDFIESGRELSLVCSVHNFYFTAASIQSLLKRCGFHTISVSEDGNDLMLTVIAQRREGYSHRFGSRLGKVRRSLYAFFSHEGTMRATERKDSA